MKCYVLLLAIAFSACWASAGFAEETSAAQPALVLDPFAQLASISTEPMDAPFCTCTPIISCSHRPNGYDCAEPPNCCHCYGPIPAERTCVGN